MSIFTDRVQVEECRTILMLGQELCRERVAKQANKKSTGARGWVFVGNQLSGALQMIAEIDRQVPADHWNALNGAPPNNNTFGLGLPDSRTPRRRGDY